MYTRAGSAIALVACLVLSPIALAGSKDKTTKPEVVKKEVAGKSHSTGSQWKTGAAPTVRSIPFQGATSRPSALGAATRPAGEYKFVTTVKYDYFSDHYGASPAKAKADVAGYVPPEKTSSNAGNPFVYRRTK